MDEGSGLTVLFVKGWKWIKLTVKLIHPLIGEAAGFDGYKFNPKGRITSIISVMEKHGSRFLTYDLYNPLE